jgi:hypothetical protein
MPQIICAKGLHMYNPALHDSCPHCRADSEQGDPGNAGTILLDAEIPADGGGFTERKTRPAKDGEATHIRGDGPGLGKPATRVAGDFGGQPLQSGQKMPAVGWLVIVHGPGLGLDFRLTQGVNRIGRNGDMEVCLDFGSASDDTVSRNSHAVVIFDNHANEFYANLGEKTSNMPQLNGKTLLSPQPLASHDVIQVGGTKLLFVPLCGAAFNW